jgi:hypothetical protein
MHLMYIIRQFYKIKGRLSNSPSLHTPHLLISYPDLAESRLRICNYLTNLLIVAPHFAIASGVH